MFGRKPYSKRIILFGSCSEGTNIKESDVDILIFTNEKGQSKIESSLHQKKIEGRIAPVIVNSKEFAKLRKEDKPLYERIVKRITLWESQ